MPGTETIVPIETTGFDGAHEHEVGADDRLDDARRRTRRLDIPLAECDRGQRRRGSASTTPGSAARARRRAASASATSTCVSTSVSVAGMSRTPSGQRACRRVGDLRWRRALAQPRRAREMGAEVEVAEREPRPADAPLAQLGRDPLGLARATPAALGVVHARERVQQRVEVGHQAHAGEPEVVAGVHDDGHGCLGAAASRRASAVRTPRERRARSARRRLRPRAP